MSLEERAPASITARVNVQKYARRQLMERVSIAIVFAATMAFVALPSFGTWWAIAIAVAALGAGAALAALRYSSTPASLESDLDALRDVAAESGGVTSTEERLQAFDSIRFLSGDVAETSRDSQPEAPRYSSPTE